MTTVEIYSRFYVVTNGIELLWYHKDVNKSLLEGLMRRQLYDYII